MLAPCDCASKTFTMLDLASVVLRRHDVDERVRGVGNSSQSQPAARQLQVYPGSVIGPFVLAAVQQATWAEKELRRAKACHRRGRQVGRGRVRARGPAAVGSM